MANTITNTTLLAGTKEAIVYVTLQSDGTQETGTVLYDSSAIAAIAGDSDTLTCKILEVYGSSNAASTARVRLLFDATTDVVAMDIPCATNPTKANFRRIGGLPNVSGTGKTGDILITTSGLGSGDTITLVLTVGRT